MSKGNESKEFLVTDQNEKIISSFLLGKTDDFARLCCTESNIKSAILTEVLRIIQTEIIGVCQKDKLPLLSLKTEDNLVSLSWDKIAKEMQLKTPTFWMFLQQAASNPRQELKNVRKTPQTLIPGIVSAGCKLILLHNRNMNALQSWNSLILLKGGAKKSAFRRFNASYDCLSYQTTLGLADKFSSNWEEKLLAWSKSVKEDIDVEKKIQTELKTLREERELMEDDAIESVYSLFCVADAETRLNAHRSSMHAGYYFVGDNVDMRTNVRQMTLTNQSKDQHMFQTCAYKLRVNGYELDDSGSKDNIDTVPFSTFVPAESDISTLVEEFSLLVAHQLCDLVHYFQPYKVVLPRHIEHRHLAETSQKTERVRDFFSL